MMDMRHLTGSLAALILIMAATMGAAAQSSDREPVTVELIGGFCSVDIAASGSFGTWNWETRSWSYVEASGTSSIEFIGQLEVNKNSGCDARVSFTGLVGADGTIAIAMDNFSATYNGEARDPVGWTETGIMSTDFSFVYTLKSIPFSVDAGTYGGYITVFVTDTA